MPVKSLFIFLFFIATANYLCAQGYPGARRMTCRQENITFDNFFRIVYEQTGMTAFYNDDQLNSYDKVSVNFKNERLDDVLARLLRKRGMAWCYRKEVLVIADKREGDVDLGYLPGEDKRIITGMVVNEKGLPLDAVAVMTADRLNGMSTEKDGKFFLRDVVPNANLLVQRTGYKPMVLSSFADSIYIQMIPMIAPLQEVNVTGVVQGMLTGSVSQVKSKEIAESPVNNVLGALQGRVPGLYINQTTGLPGGGYRIRLRGKNSIESNSDPLILVDGVPFPSVSFNENFFNMSGTTGANVAPSPLNLLSVNDIESIQILKDADATAMYGTRGANGVILIKSKQPDEQGKWITGTANVYKGIGMATNLVHYLDTKHYLQMRWEGIRNDGREPDSTRDYDMLVWDTTRYTDWQKKMIGGAADILDGSIELKGGNSHFGYRSSGLYRKESTVYPSEDIKYQYIKGGAMAQLWFTSRDRRLTIELSGNYVADRNLLPINDLTKYAVTPPNTPDIYTADNKLNFAKGTFANPYAMLLQTSKVKSRSFRPFLNTSWKPIDELTFNASIGGSTISVDEVLASPARSFDPATGIDYGTSTFYTKRYKNGLADLQGIWKKTIGKEQFSLLAGARFQFEEQLKKGYLAWGFKGDDASLEDSTAGEAGASLDSSKTDFHYQSFYGRLEYKHADKYMLSLTLNRDGSTRLSRAYGTFGAIGAAWVFTRESWFKQHNLLSFGKLRASYGITGNDQYVKDVKNGTYMSVIFPKGGIRPGTNYSPSDTWEKIRKAEVAVELGFLNDKLLTTFCYYNNRSTNQLITGLYQTIVNDAPTEEYMAMNVGTVVENRGFEIDLEGTVLRNGRVTWTTNLNLSFPKNKLVSFPFIDRSKYQYFYSEGKSVDLIMGYHLQGVDRDSGFYRFENVGSKDISLEDRKFAKEFGPFFYGGWYNQLRYNNFELSWLFRYTRQNNYSYQYSSFSIPGDVGNQPSVVLNRWQRPGDSGPAQQYTTSLSTPAGVAFSRVRESDQQLTDASYFRLQSLVFAYYFSHRILMRIKIKSCKLYIQGLNLFTLTKYKGRDPEVTAGPDNYPSLRVVTGGLQVSF